MERLETKQVKGHTYYYYSQWEWLTTAVDASGRNTSANSKISSRPAKGPDQLPSPPRSSSGDCPRPSGRKPRGLGSWDTLTGIAPNGGKV